MTTYNTGNNIGSTDPRDLYDNAENLDNAVNDLTSPTWKDRRGNTRTTLAGQIGYIGTGADGAIEDYAAGQELTTFSTIIRYNGEFYRPSASASLPYTTTTATPDVDANLVPVGDATLRQDLANPATSGGSDLVAHAGTTDTVTEALDKRTIYVESVAEIEALSLPVGTNVYLTQDGRAGEFVVKSGTPPNDPQKGIYIVLANGNYAQRINIKSLTPEMFGAVGDGVADDSVPVKECIDAGDFIILSKAYSINSQITVGQPNKTIIGYPRATINYDTAYALGIFVTESNVKIANLDFNVNNNVARAIYSNTASNVTVENCSFQDCGLAVYLTGSTGTYPTINYVQNCAVINCRAYNVQAAVTDKAGVGGFELSACKDSRIDNCKVFTSDVKSIVLGYAYNCKVLNCAVYDAVGSLAHGFYFARGKKNALINPIVINANNVAIKLSRSETETVIRNPIIDMTNVTDSALYNKAISMQGTFRCVIEGGVLDIGAGDGILVMDHPPQGGDPYTTADSRNNSVLDVKIGCHAVAEAGNIGIYFDKVDNEPTVCFGNSIKGLQIIDRGGSVGIGIRVRDQNKVTIADVQIEDCVQTYGVTGEGTIDDIFMDRLFIEHTTGARALYFTQPTTTRFKIGTAYIKISGTAVGCNLEANGSTNIENLFFEGGASSGNLRYTVASSVDGQLFIGRLVEFGAVSACVGSGARTIVNNQISDFQFSGSNVVVASHIVENV